MKGDDFHAFDKHIFFRQIVLLSSIDRETAIRKILVCVTESLCSLSTFYLNTL